MPAGNLLSDVGFPPCACIIGEERGSSAGRSPPRLCRGLACGVFLSPTGFIYSHARQGGFSHSAAGSGLRGVLAGWCAACCLPSRREAPRENCAPRAWGASPPQPRCQGAGAPRNCPAWEASSPGSPYPRPLVSSQHFRRENPIFVFICQGVGRRNHHPRLSPGPSWASTGIVQLARRW